MLNIYNNILHTTCDLWLLNHRAKYGDLNCVQYSCACPTRQQEWCCNKILPHTFIGRAWLQRWRDPKPRIGAAYIGLGEACLTPGLVMHYSSFTCSSSDWYSLSLYLTEPHYHTSFACLTSDWLYSQSLIIMPGSVFAKNFTAYVHIGCLSKLMRGGQ